MDISKNIHLNDLKAMYCMVRDVTVAMYGLESAWAEIQGIR